MLLAAAASSSGPGDGLYPDVERTLALLLVQFVDNDTGRVGSETPADLEGRLPFIQVVRYGGPDNGVTDEAAVDVDCFAASRSEAVTLARQVHEFLTSGRHGGSGVPLLDQLTTSVGVVERPRPGGNVRRFGGSYTVSARRSPA